MSSRLKRDKIIRVFMTADAVGGVWQYALDLARALQPHGVETSVAVLGPSPSAEQQRSATKAGVSLVATGMPLDWTANATDEVEEAGRAIARLAAEVEPDIVHLNSPALAASGRFAVPVVAVAHSCVATWWQAVRTGPLPQEFIWRTELVRRGYRASDAILAPTAAFADATAETYGLPERPVVVRNGRKTPLADPAPQALPSVFTAGRLWDDGKNLAALDRAAARLSVPVVAAGPVEGPNGARIALRHLQTLGRLDDDAIAQCLSARPIFVSVAHYEPFGLAALEAAQAGCALVLSDIPTFRELWDGAAAFVPADDHEAIASVTEHLLRDADARSRLGRMARERSKTYSVEAMAEGVLAVYRALAARRSEGETAKEAAA